MSTFSVICYVFCQNNETPFIINDNSSLYLLFIVDGAQREAAGPEFGDPKLQGKYEDSSLLPGVGLWRVSPITDADENDDEGDDEEGDVQNCVCMCVRFENLHFLCVNRFKSVR